MPRLLTGNVLRGWRLALPHRTERCRAHQGATTPVLTRNPMRARRDLWAGPEGAVAAQSGRYHGRSTPTSGPMCVERIVVPGRLTSRSEVSQSHLTLTPTPTDRRASTRTAVVSVRARRASAAALSLDQVDQVVRQFLTPMLILGQVEVPSELLKLDVIGFFRREPRDLAVLLQSHRPV